MPKVLVVENNELNLKLFRDLLRTLHYELILSEDGKDVEEIAQTQSPDLVLMDIQLGPVSGIELIHALKHNKLTSHIPIISITACAMPGDEERILAAGADIYLSKPISLESFFHAVTKLINTEMA